MLGLSLNIILTRKCCPCGCNYCNVFKHEINNFFEDNFKYNEYSDNIIKDIIFFTKKNNIDSIRFFWGEVFLKKDILKNFVYKLREFWFKKNIYVNTNLHLFEKKDINWIIENNIQLITSLNWKQYIHTKTRGISWKDFKKLIENINYIISHKIKLQINMVLFPYDNDMIDNLNYVLWFKSYKINLLPLMYSSLLKDDIIWSFIKKLDNLGSFIHRNKLQSYFLNFDLLYADKKEVLPLLDEDYILDSDGWLYYGMLILETFFNNYKDLLRICNCKNINSIDFDKNNYKILVKKIFIKLYETNISIYNSIKVSNKFTDILLKYKK